MRFWPLDGESLGNPIIAIQEHVVTYTKATIALHNHLRKTEFTYCPVGFVDSEDNDGNISEGAWREEAMAGLGPIHRLGSHRHSSAAATIRDAFKDYFSSPAGEVQWQYQRVHRTCYLSLLIILFLYLHINVL